MNEEEFTTWELKLFDEISANISKDPKGKILCLDGENNPVLFKLANSFSNEIVASGSTPDIYINKMNDRIRYIYDPRQGLHFPDRHFQVIFIRKGISKSRHLEYLLKNNLHALESGGIFLFRMVDSGRNREKLQTILNKQGNFTYKAENKIPTNSYSVFVITKSKKVKRKAPANLSILLLFSGTGGVSEYSKVLAVRMEKEYDATVQICHSINEIKYETIIIEYAPALIESSFLMSQVRSLIEKRKRIVLDVHDWLPIRGKDREFLEKNCLLTFKSYEISQLFGKTDKFYLFPHLSYNFRIPRKKDESFRKGRPLACTFGYASKGKRLLNIVEMAKTNGLDLKILIGTSTEWSGGDGSLGEIMQLLKTSGMTKLSDDSYQLKVDDSEITAKTSNYSTSDLIEELQDCDLFAFAHANNYQPSGSLVFSREFGVPVVCTDSVKARLSQVSIVTSLLETQRITDSVSYLKIPLMFHIFHPGNLVEDLKQIYYHAINSFRILVKTKIFSVDNLELHHPETNFRIDDGIAYLNSILSMISE